MNEAPIKWAQLIVSVLIFVVLILFTKCTPNYEYRTYKLTYYNGDTETLTYKLEEFAHWSLREGDFRPCLCKPTRSGVRQVRVSRTVKIENND